MKLFLVRHGQTVLNLRRKFYGKLDVSLTQAGVEEALAIAKQLKEIPVTKIYTSSLTRTKETAARIIHANQWQQLAIEVASFDEKNMGIWEGLDADEIEQLDPHTWQQFLNEPLQTTPKDAEPYTTFCHRIEQGFHKIKMNWQTDDIVLIIGHQGVLRHIARRFLGDQRDFFAIEFKQGCVYEYEWDG